MARVGVFGAGYAGLVTGAGFAELGHEVTVCDVVPAKIEALEAGRVPFHEPGLEELLERNRERLRYTLDAADASRGAQLIFVCVARPRPTRATPTSRPSGPCSTSSAASSPGRCS